MAGLEDPDVLDLVAELDGVAVLVMVEDRPWGTDPDQLDQLAAKASNYANYVVDGFSAAYPDLAEWPVTIRLDCVTPPPSELAALLEQVRARLAVLDIGFEVHLRPLGHGSGPSR